VVRILRTRRVVLAPMSLELMATVLSGDWPAAERVAGAAMPEEWQREPWDWLRHHVTAADQEPDSTAWGPHLIFAADVVVGEAGSTAPRGGRAEIG
jgi:hypothetical protein